MWLTGRLAPDLKTIANFRRDNGPAIRAVCVQFVELCRRLNLFTRAIVAIDGSKFKAGNTRDKNFTVAKVGKRMTRFPAMAPLWTPRATISRSRAAMIGRKGSCSGLPAGKMILGRSLPESR